MMKLRQVVTCFADNKDHLVVIQFVSACASFATPGLLVSPV